MARWPTDKEPEAGDNPLADDMAELYPNVDPVTGKPKAYQLPEGIASLQRMINSGDAWRMEGSFGRGAMAALEAGAVMLGQSAVFDYWGNRVPARSEVKPGTKGSRALVAEQNGEDYAAALEALGTEPLGSGNDGTRI